MAGQDYTRTITPGGISRINANGETFVFCKTADRPIIVEIGGKKVVMRAGSYQEFEPLLGQNSQVVLYNTDADNPAFVELVMGTGTYDEKIVRGEIMVEPGLRSADGTFKTDTRKTVTIDLVPSNMITTAYQSGDVIAARAVTSEIQAFWGPNGLLTTVNSLGADVYEFEHRDPVTLDIIETQLLKAGLYSGREAFTYWPGVGIVGLQNFTAQNEIYQLTADGNNPLLFAVVTGPGVEDKVSSIDYDPITGGLACYCGSSLGIEYRGVRIYDLTGAEVVEKIEAPEDQAEFAVDRTTGNLQFGTSTIIATWNRAGLQLETANHAAADYQKGFAVKGDDVWAFAAGTTVALRKLALRSYVTKPEFRAIRPGCSMYTGLVKQDQVPQILADITATELPGAVLVSGEVIRAALEYHYRQKAPADYLDHIYYLDLTRDGSGNPFNPISTGNATFDRANIADDFATMLPGRITLTIDNELTLGGPL